MDHWDNIKHYHILIIGIPEGGEREKETECIFEELIAKNFPNLGSETDIQVQEAQKVPNKMNSRRLTQRQYYNINGKS